MNSNPNFVQSVEVVLPSIEEPPAECNEYLADEYLQLELITQELTDLANVGEYLFNPVYPIASDLISYYSCNNIDIFAEECGV